MGLSPHPAPIKEQGICRSISTCLQQALGAFLASRAPKIEWQPIFQMGEDLHPISRSFLEILQSKVRPDHFISAAQPTINFHPVALLSTLCEINPNSLCILERYRLRKLRLAVENTGLENSPVRLIFFKKAEYDEMLAAFAVAKIELIQPVALTQKCEVQDLKIPHKVAHRPIRQPYRELKPQRAMIG